MKQKFFKRLAAVAAVLLLSAVSASAHDFEVDGIYYKKNSDGTSVSVTFEGSSYNSYANEYSGAVTIPASVTYSGKTYSVTSIGSSAFRECSGLTSVSIGNSVTSIGSDAFAYCSGLTSVEIPNSVTTIGYNAFYDCSGLTSVEIPNSVTSIGFRAFYDCSGLTSVSIGNSVTSIGNYAFQGCSGLKKVEISDLEAWCKISFSNTEANPTYYSHNLFLNGQEIKNLIIPESVQELKFAAFWGCTGLTSVEIPNSVTSIGAGAFYGCSGLKKVEIYDLEAWCKISFYNSTANPTYYSHNLFLNGQEIKNLIIPATAQELKSYVFNGCSGLTSVVIPNSVTSIGEDAFSGCSGLTSVSIGNSVTSIGSSAFYDCSGLTSVEIPNSITSIGKQAFYNCSGLTSVSIGNSVTSIGQYAFWVCNGLKLVFFNAKNCSINNSFFSSDLTLVIGADVEQIEGQLLSSNVTKIVTQAATPPVITSQTFSDKSCPLYVTQGAYAKYWTADIWDDFSDMRPIENPITKIELNKSSLNLVANSAQLSATITPSNATLKDIYWVSDNPAIASVDQNGKVTGLKTGITTITAMAIDGSGVKATCEVLFTENLTLNPSELTLAINQSAKITPVMTPDNASSTSLEWSTSNASVAPFRANSDGSITVLGAADGVATITCRTTNGSNLTSTCTVTVGTGAVDGIEADALTVRGENGIIRVEGAEGARVEVFNTAGVCIYSGTDTEITVPQRGLYVVKVAGRATKLVM